MVSMVIPSITRWLPTSLQPRPDDGIPYPSSGDILHAMGRADGIASTLRIFGGAVKSHYPHRRDAQYVLDAVLSLLSVDGKQSLEKLLESWFTNRQRRYDHRDIYNIEQRKVLANVLQRFSNCQLNYKIDGIVPKIFPLHHGWVTEEQISETTAGFQHWLKKQPMDLYLYDPKYHQD